MPPNAAQCHQIPPNHWRKKTSPLFAGSLRSCLFGVNPAVGQAGLTGIIRDIVVVERDKHGSDRTGEQAQPDPHSMVGIAEIGPSDLLVGDHQYGIASRRRSCFRSPYSQNRCRVLVFQHINPALADFHRKPAVRGCGRLGDDTAARQELDILARLRHALTVDNLPVKDVGVRKLHVDDAGDRAGCLL